MDQLITLTPGRVWAIGSVVQTGGCLIIDEGLFNDPLPSSVTYDGTSFSSDRSSYQVIVPCGPESF